MYILNFKLSYSYAHKLQVKINKLQTEENKKAEDLRLKKFEIEINKIKLKHAHEAENLKLRLSKKFTEFKRKRALDFEMLLQGSKNKQDKLQITQKKLLNYFKHPNTAKAKTMNITQPLSRTFQSNLIVHNINFRRCIKYKLK